MCWANSCQRTVGRSWDVQLKNKPDISVSLQFMDLPSFLHIWPQLTQKISEYENPTFKRSLLSSFPSLTGGLFISFSLLCNKGTWTHDLTHSRTVSYHWVTYPQPVWDSFWEEVLLEVRLPWKLVVIFYLKLLGSWHRRHVPQELAVSCLQTCRGIHSEATPNWACRWWLVKTGVLAAFA